LISSDPALAHRKSCGACLWRWEIEFNFRDEELRLGFVQPQVRSNPAARTATLFVFVCALLRRGYKIKTAPSHESDGQQSLCRFKTTLQSAVLFASG